MSNSKKIIVTGGAGYIGSHICKSLHKVGYKTITIDNFSSGHRSFIKWGELEDGDILDEYWLTSKLKKHLPIAIIHCAGLSSVEESYKDTEKYFQNNVQGTSNLLTAMKDLKLNNLVYSSTASVYGSSHSKPIKENEAPNPENPYAKSKLEAEKLIKDSGITSVTLRYFNASGADANCDTGESHNPETHLIPLAIKAAENNGIFNINGDDYQTADGSAVRDFIHVTDIALAHISAINYCFKNKGFNVFNLGSGHGFSVKDIIKKVEEVMGKKMLVKVSKRRQGDPPILIADNQIATSELNFTTSNSSLDNIIKTALSWHQNQHHLNQH